MATKKKTALAKKKTIASTRIHTATVTIFSDGSWTMKRANNGFSVMEVMALGAMMQADMLEIIRGAAVHKLPSGKDITRSSQNSPMFNKPGA